MTAIMLRGDARSLPLPDACVDLLVTSPPYFGLRSYTDGGEHYDRQIGSEATPAAYLEALWACTREWVRVLKPGGSMFVNLGDRYASRPGAGPNSTAAMHQNRNVTPLYGEGTPKSLLGIPWRYAIGCTDQLGLILRAEVIWSKPNGLPESVTDRVRRAHEQVFHFTKQPRYYAAVDEIREPTVRKERPCELENRWTGHAQTSRSAGNGAPGHQAHTFNPLGKLPGSVWSIPSAPLKVPEKLGIDHFACVDDQTEILTIRGWMRHYQLEPGDTVAAYDLDTATARWTACTAVNRYDYDGEMVAVESRDLSMRLTPNHRTIVQRMHTRSHKRSPLNVVRADQLDARHFIPRSAAWDQYGHTFLPDRRSLPAMMGWVAAEGWYDGNRVRLSQSLDANPAAVTDIDRLIPDAARHERKRAYRGQPWTEVVWTLGPIGDLIKRWMPDKLLPWMLVARVESERRACLNAFIDGDGHRRPDGRIAIFQKHRHNLDVLQAIAVTLGYKTTLRKGDERFVLYLTEGGRSVTLRGTSGVGSKVKRERYAGIVWCPTTGTGTFIARRNGSVFVTGNSFPPALVRPLVLGWSPPGVCTACGEGRRPVVDRERIDIRPGYAKTHNGAAFGIPQSGGTKWKTAGRTDVTITGYACGCPSATDPNWTCYYCHHEPDDPRYDDPSVPLDCDCSCHRGGRPAPPTRPAVVLDPFGGTGTTALVASTHGRVGVTVDRSADYCRLAAWRVHDPGERARARDMPKPPPVPEGMEPLFTM